MKQMMRSAVRQLKANPVPWLLTGIVIVFELMKLLVGYRPWKPTSVLGHIDETVYMFSFILYAALALAIAVPKKLYYEQLKRIVAAGVPILVLTICLLFWLTPATADLWSSEDRSVEYLSAAASLAAFVVWAGLTVLLAKNRRWRLMVVTLLFALVMLAIGGEEISWGQRLFNIESSQYMQMNNMQGEMNLHNLDTHLSETLFYGVGILVLVVLPFFRTQLAALLSQLKAKWLTIFLPSPWMAVAFLPMVGMLNSWKRSPTLVVAVSGLAIGILIYLGLEAVHKKNIGKFVGLLAIGLITLVAGVTFRFYPYDIMPVRDTASSEFFELIVQIGLLVYALDFILRNDQLFNGKTIASRIRSKLSK